MTKLRIFGILCMLLLVAGTELSASIFHPHHKQQPSYKVSKKNRDGMHLYGSNKKNHYKAPKYQAHKPKTHG